MGTITTGLCNSFKHELLKGLHDFDSDTFKIALIKASPTDSYSAATTNYSVGSYDNDGGTSFSVNTTLTGNNNDEHANGNGYTTNGNTLGSVSVTLTSTTAHIDFADPQWTSATIDSDGCLIYNASSKGSVAGRAVCVISFGSTQSADNGTFTITMPSDGASTSIIRVA
tara:strand:+ start:474 stop:980 length:507 start_codon:yes stop_codon:yes gene_type:complete